MCWPNAHVVTHLRRLIWCKLIEIFAHNVDLPPVALFWWILIRPNPWAHRGSRNSFVYFSNPQGRNRLTIGNREKGKRFIFSFIRKRQNKNVQMFMFTLRQSVGLFLLEIVHKPVINELEQIYRKIARKNDIKMCRRIDETMVEWRVPELSVAYDCLWPCDEDDAALYFSSSSHF